MFYSPSTMAMCQPLQFIIKYKKKVMFNVVELPRTKLVHIIADFIAAINSRSLKK